MTRPDLTLLPQEERERLCSAGGAALCARAEAHRPRLGPLGEGETHCGGTAMWQRWTCTDCASVLFRNWKVEINDTNGG